MTSCDFAISKIHQFNQLKSHPLWDHSAKILNKLEPRRSSSSVAGGLLGPSEERQSGMDFQSAMETFAEAWVAATAGAQVQQFCSDGKGACDSD